MRLRGTVTYASDEAENTDLQKLATKDFKPLNEGFKLKSPPLPPSRQTANLPQHVCIHTHRHTHTQSVLSCWDIREIPGLALGYGHRSAAAVERFQPGVATAPSSVSHNRSPPLTSTCPRQTQTPWPGRGWRGHTPPPRFSSRHTSDHHSASSVGRSSGWAGGSPSPAHWWSWRCGAAGCSLLLWRCSPPVVTGDTTAPS